MSLSMLSALDAVRRFFSGARFPVFALSLVFFYEIVLIAMIFIPAAPTGLGAFAEDFRIWCFGYDPSTGRMNLSYPLSFLAPPVMMALFFALLWIEPLREALNSPLRMLRDVGAAGVVISAMIGSFVLLGVEPAQGELPFPAEALRISQHAPAFRLTDQNGQPVDLAALRGSVVVLTAVYASCPHTCPLILAQARDALDELTPGERARVRVVAVTIDPAHDSPEVLAELASMHGLDASTWRLVTGEIPEVERVLDSMDVARQRNPETGVIDHANIFLLLDAQGQVAYRLSLGDRQKRWLISALRVLVDEVPHAG